MFDNIGCWKTLLELTFSQNFHPILSNIAGSMLDDEYFKQAYIIACFKALSHGAILRDVN